MHSYKLNYTDYKVLNQWYNVIHDRRIKNVKFIWRCIQTNFRTEIEYNRKFKIYIYIYLSLLDPFHTLPLESTNISDEKTRR